MIDLPFECTPQVRSYINALGEDSKYKSIEVYGPNEDFNDLEGRRIAAITEHSLFISLHNKQESFLAEIPWSCVAKLIISATRIAIYEKTTNEKAARL